mgnify:CR=1 FL=1|jgi:hypothetical protein
MLHIYADLKGPGFKGTVVASGAHIYARYGSVSVVNDYPADDNEVLATSPMIISGETLV